MAAEPILRGVAVGLVSYLPRKLQNAVKTDYEGGAVTSHPYFRIRQSGTRLAHRGRWQTGLPCKGISFGRIVSGDKLKSLLESVEWSKSDKLKPHDRKGLALISTV